jgi:hypothetical protein
MHAIQMRWKERTADTKTNKPFTVGGGKIQRKLRFGGLSLFQRRRAGVVGVSRATSSAGIQPFIPTISSVANTRIGDIHICKTKIGGVFHEGKR